jgi:hypothetical protein
MSPIMTMLNGFYVNIAAPSERLHVGQHEADIERARAVDVANRTAVTVQTHQLGSCGMRKSFMPTPSNANRC